MITPHSPCLADEEYSLIMDMTPAHKFNKLFAKSLPETLENVQPYWLRAETKPLSDDVSLITYVTEDQLDEFVALAERWQDVGRSGKEDDGIRLRFDGVFGTRWKVRREGATWRDKKRGDSANPFFMVIGDRGVLCCCTRTREILCQLIPIRFLFTRSHLRNPPSRLHLQPLPQRNKQPPLPAPQPPRVESNAKTARGHPPYHHAPSPPSSFASAQLGPQPCTALRAH
ncbi:hypothetical protein BC936DRAFT_145336 [Jimgerdemannia flammicorona]|uniref:Uncharacterized protein n=1 Tax=Jimgerdemannia flammicorona TaxID=994334 RepID=A0A433DAB4_9FUNG|nr:hypothetical protein BC936DRAFT_145336 [Jimgerdemannia flammicorona]